ncbi:ABC transporter ATP-binding protein [Intrasporangium mesophilum]
MAGELLLETSGLGKRFGRSWALRGLSLAIERGEVFGYLGPNGAGKTTTIRLLLGLLRPTAGSAAVCGHDAWRDSVAVRRRVGYLPGEPATYGRMTGRQHVEYLSRLRGQPWFPRADELAARLVLDLDRPARDLSRGNRQKLALVLALMPPVDLLVLDEPTSGLDPLAQQEFHVLLREHAASGGAVLLSSHVLSEVQRVADRVGVLRSGELIAVDRLDQLRSRSLHHIHATFEDPVDAADFASLPDVRDVMVADHTMTCSAPEDALDSVVKALGRHTLRDLTCTEAELEETFLAYYGTGDHHAA